MMGQRRFCVVNDGAKTFFAYQMTGQGLFSEKKFDEAKTFSEKKRSTGQGLFLKKRIDGLGTFLEKNWQGENFFWKKGYGTETKLGWKKSLCPVPVLVNFAPSLELNALNFSHNENTKTNVVLGEYYPPPFWKYFSEQTHCPLRRLANWAPIWREMCQCWK